MKALAAIALTVAAVAAFADERAIRKEVTVKAPVEAAWAAWTTGEGLQSFFSPEAVVNPRPGGAYYIHFNPHARPGLRGADDMRVLAVQPNRMISFTWNAPPHLPEARGQKTVVIVRLEPAAEESTRVTLTHVGWGEGGQWDAAFKYFDNAWGRVLANMQKRFADDKPVDWAPLLAKLKADETSPERVLRIEKVVNAPPAEVWKALSTDEGVRRWAAPLATVQLRAGGWLRAAYDKTKSLGGPGVIHSDVLSVIPGELAVYKVNLTDQFPAKARMEDARLQHVLRLEPAEGGKTRVISTMVGWGSGKEWEEVYDFFAKGNDWSLNQLAAAFK